MAKTKSEMTKDELAAAFEDLSAYLGTGLTARIHELEVQFTGRGVEHLAELMQMQRVAPESLRQARVIKRATGQIHVVIHALGVLLSLPWVLEPGEVVEGLSLGAGNTPERRYDLETNIRVAEFTFIDWKGRDSARQDKLFKDFFLLAESDTHKRRCLYVNDRDAATRCLTSGRACKSLLGRNANAGTRFSSKYSATMRASEYFRVKKASVEITEIPGIEAVVSQPRGQ